MLASSIRLEDVSGGDSGIGRRFAATNAPPHVDASEAGVSGM